LLCLTLFIICATLAVRLMLLQLRVAFARGQVETFTAVAAEAAGITNPAKLAESLRYVSDYYPSGSKHKKGSALDLIVETARSNATAAISDRLRSVKADHSKGISNSTP
jgi:hypothetical protein